MNIGHVRQITSMAQLTAALIEMDGKPASRDPAIVETRGSEAKAESPREMFVYEGDSTPRLPAQGRVGRAGTKGS